MPGRKKMKRVELPIRQIRKECFMALPYSRKLNWGIVFGKIIRMQKGNEFDIVEIDVGCGYGQQYTRKFVCKTLDSRKQLSTLKCGKMCIVFCLMPKYDYKIKCELICQALGFWCAYVPLAFDRVELETQQFVEKDLERLNEQEESQTQKDFLSLFENE